MYWIIDESLNERQYETGFPTLAGAARSFGAEVITIKYKPFETPEKLFAWEDLPSKGSCVVCYGTVEFCKKFESLWGKMCTPGLYFNNNVKHFSRFAHRIESRNLLNSDYAIIPYGEFVRRQYARAGFTCFVKPESGMKQFTGQLISAASFEEDLKNLSPHHQIDSDELVVIASPQHIKAEFRYVIANRKVITGSEYRWDNVLDVRTDTHPVADVLAEKIAKAEWQADTVYVCDIALINQFSGPIAKVVELNAFSSSGLYACDTNKIVEAVSSAAMKEWSGELENE